MSSILKNIIFLKRKTWENLSLIKKICSISCSITHHIRHKSIASIEIFYTTKPYIFSSKIVEIIKMYFKLNIYFALGKYENFISLFWSFSSVQSLSCVWLFATPWTRAPGLPVHHQPWSIPKPMSIELVMPSSHLILCHSLFLLPSIFPSIRVFSNESALRIR